MFRKVIASWDITAIYDGEEIKEFTEFRKVANPFDIPKKDGMIYVRVRAIASKVNNNFDGFERDELGKYYKTFIGKPVFVEHENSTPEYARGIIVDSAFHDDQPHAWIELLLEVDGEAYPLLAEGLKSGRINKVSMGTNVDHTVCSVCGNIARSKNEYCNHIKNKGRFFKNNQGIDVLAYEINRGLDFFEISFVISPAEEWADVLEVYAEQTTKKLQKVASNIRKPKESIRCWEKRTDHHPMKKVAKAQSIEMYETAEVIRPNFKIAQEEESRFNYQLRQWIIDDEYIMEMANEHLKNAGGDIKDANYEFSNALKDYVEQLVYDVENVPESGMVADMVGTFLANVDWYDLADTFLQDAEYTPEEEEEFDAEEYFGSESKWIKGIHKAAIRALRKKTASDNTDGFLLISDNDRELYETFYGIAEAYLEQSEDEYAALDDAASEMYSYVEQTIEEGGELADTCATEYINNIDFGDVAKHYIDKVKEISAYESSRESKQKRMKKKAQDEDYITGRDFVEKYRNRLEQLDKEIIRDWIGSFDAEAANKELDAAEIQTDEGEEVYGGWDNESQGQHYKSVFLGDELYNDFRNEYDRYLVDDFEDELDEDQRDALSESLIDAAWDTEAFEEIVNGWNEALGESNSEYYQFVSEMEGGMFAIRILTDKQYAEETGEEYIPIHPGQEKLFRKNKEGNEVYKMSKKADNLAKRGKVKILKEKGDIVLAEWSDKEKTEYVTWKRSNGEKKGFVLGHYFAALDDAEKDYEARIKVFAKTNLRKKAQKLEDDEENVSAPAAPDTLTTPEGDEVDRKSLEPVEDKEEKTLDSFLDKLQSQVIDNLQNLIDEYKSGGGEEEEKEEEPEEEEEETIIDEEIPKDDEFAIASKKTMKKEGESSGMQEQGEETPKEVSLAKNLLAKRLVRELVKHKAIDDDEQTILAKEMEFLKESEEELMKRIAMMEVIPVSDGIPPKEAKVEKKRVPSLKTAIASDREPMNVESNDPLNISQMFF